jgi:hypothetical protein
MFIMFNHKTAKYIFVSIYIVLLNNIFDTNYFQYNRLNNLIEQNISYFKYSGTNMAIINEQIILEKIQNIEKRSLSIENDENNTYLIDFNTFGVLIIAVTLVASVIGLCINHKKKLSKMYFKKRNIIIDLETKNFEEKLNKKRNCFPVSVTLPYNVMQLSSNSKLPSSPSSIVLDIDSSKTSFKYDLPFKKAISQTNNIQAKISESPNINLVKKQSENRFKNLISPSLVEKLVLSSKFKFNKSSLKLNKKSSNSLSTIREEDFDTNTFQNTFQNIFPTSIHVAP